VITPEPDVGAAVHAESRTVRFVQRAGRWLALLLMMLVSFELGARISLLLIGGDSRVRQDLLVGDDREVKLAPDGTELRTGRDP
jgi:hypothetical protein